MNIKEKVSCNTEDAVRVNGKVNLMGLSASSLADLMEMLGEKRFRATQILKWIHQMGVRDFDQMTNLSKVLRGKLSEGMEIVVPEVVSCENSS